MPKYKVVWQVAIALEVEAPNKAEAIVEAEDTDCQHDGEYVTDSFEITKVEEVKS